MATADDDYVSGAFDVTFGVGDTSAEVSINITDDIIDEGSEAFGLVLKRTDDTPDLVEIVDPMRATGIIDDDDETVTVSFNTTVVRDDESAGSLKFVISTNRPADVSFTIQVCTEDIVVGSGLETATADDDYVSDAIDVTFGVGDTSAIVCINITDDMIDEGNEAFGLVLKTTDDTPDFVEIVDPMRATGIINDDDETVTVSFNTTIVRDAESAGSLTFFLETNRPVDVSFTVQVCTENIDLRPDLGIATADDDYDSGAFDVTFGVGDTSAEVSINITDDNINEGNEAFGLVLKTTGDTPDLVEIVDPMRATGIIDDDDELVVRFLNDTSSAVESEGSILFTVISLVQSDNPFTVQVCTRESDLLSAEADVDYTSVVTNITFNNGDNSQVVAVPITDDEIAEADETFEVFLKNFPDSPYNVIFADPSVAVGTIFDNEIPSVEFLFNSTTVGESDGVATFTLISSFPFDESFTVQVTSGETDPVSARRDEDYTPTVVNVTFPAGVTMVNITVPVVPDLVIEDTEMFHVSIDELPDQPVTLAEQNTSLGIIIDDDTPLTVKFSTTSVRDDESAGNLTFIVETNRPADVSFTVQVCTEDVNLGPDLGMATADDDYDSGAINVTFGVGDTNAEVSINVNDDSIDEGSEAFRLVLKRTDDTPDFVEIVDPMNATGIIDDDDEPGVRFRSDSSTAPESNGFIMFVIELVGSSDSPVTVQVFSEETIPRQAQGGGVDYSDTIENITFEIDDTTKIVNVPIANDCLVESSENFNVILRRFDTNVELMSPFLSVGTITDTTPVRIQFAEQTVSNFETDSPMEFELVLSGPVDRAVLVEVMTNSDSAVGGVDYDDVLVNVTFPAGSTSQVVTVNLIDDGILEPTEQFTIEIIGVHHEGDETVPCLLNGTVLMANGVILNNDTLSVMFNSSTYSGAEADGIIPVTVVATGTASIPYTVIITPSESDPQSATAIVDFSSDTIDVTFNAGETSKTVNVVINPDCLREGSEFFNLSLSLSSVASILGVGLGDPSEAVAEIEDTDIIYVNFSQAVYSDEEANCTITITIEADGFSIWPFSVVVTPIEIGGSNGAIGGGIDFTSDPLTAIFTPGASQATVELNITKDGLFEETEMLKFNLTVPDEFSNINGMLLIKTGDNDMADGEIINSGVLVNFTASCYDVDANETEAIVRVMAFGQFDTDFAVNVIAAISDQSEQSEAFFTEGVYEAQFSVGDNTAQASIQVFPERLRIGTTGLFNVTLEAVDDGVIIGSPSEAVVKIPAP